VQVAKWLVTGAGGQLGHDVVALLTDAEEAVTGLARADLDITDPKAVDAAIAALGDDGVVINCAAYTAVDDAESDEDTAHALNATAPGLLAEACKRHGARLVHVSTDYVFAGDEHTPYDEETRTQPRTAYGRTKLAGEEAVLASGAHAFVVRTAWVYGAAGANFVRTMANLAAQRDTLTVVDDQVGSPTWTTHLARGLIGIATSDVPPGVWHCTNSGQTSWCGFARAVFEELGLDPERVQPTTTDKFPRPAPRPAYSVLSGAKWAAAGLPAMPSWREALHEAFETEGERLTAAR
jgi:dTDP-4-dehydrorhamnose reductase